ncbi:RNA polymerase sigma factor [Clostridioides difficile]
MEITIKINGQAVSAEVSYEVYECLCESDRKTENLSHQKRRHWDMREFDEYIIATECSHIYTPTPEEILCHRETMCELMAVLATCTEVQQERFLLYALEDMSFSEIALYCGCSKNAVMQSISAVRKKYKDFCKKYMYEMPFSGL